MSAKQAKQRLLKRLSDRLSENFSARDGEQLCLYADQIYRGLPAEDLLQWRDEDLYGRTLESWRFLEQFDRRQARVKVFNPAFEHQGWQSRHTVLFVLSRNMPFLVDSVRGELNRRGITIHSLNSTVMPVVRDSSGQLVEVLPARSVIRGSDGAEFAEEAQMYFEINRHSDQAYLQSLCTAVVEILDEVSVVTTDHQAMTARCEQAIADIAASEAIDEEQRQERQAFLAWLQQNHFTFLGYEYLQCEQGRISQSVGSGLGLLRDAGLTGEAELQGELRRLDSQTLRQQQIVCSKSALRSRVHRQVYPDYVTVKCFDTQGELIGQHRFLGLYTSRVFTLSPSLIPLVRQKISAILDLSGLDLATHEGNNLVRLLEIFPREELLQSSVDQLFETTSAINRIQERRQVRLFVRYDPYGRFVNCLVYMPRDVYSTTIRQKVEALLCQAFAATESEFTTFFSESILTRTHYVLKRDDSRHVHVDNKTLEEELIKVTMSWKDHLRTVLLEELGEEKGSRQLELFGDGFPAGYMDEFSPRDALSDLTYFQQLSAADSIAMRLYSRAGDSDGTARFRLYHRDQPLPLSDVMPILENMGLRVLSESPYGIRSVSSQRFWVHEFTIQFQGSTALDVLSVSDLFHAAFEQVWYQHAENDSLNRLVIAAGLSWRQVVLLRAIARYLKQIRFAFSFQYMADTLCNYAEISRLLLSLFDKRFNPASAFDQDQTEALENEILQCLDAVPNLNEDQILRQFMHVIKAILRSNYFQTQNGEHKSYISIKLSPATVPGMPQPIPAYEIYVYSPDFEGVHLRGGKVARGGLRWSDRQEDYRTEVLGLVKAQQVKNAVIVPTGAKGGFVVRQLPDSNDRQLIQEAGIACYRQFIRGLLDLTDNLQNGELLPPRDVVCHDDADSYLVVAADKGTASFSDIANEEAAAYDFWMGDAFASGGSAGYDHKKMGITARGAWVSVQRHFRELGVNVQTEPFTVLAIGDMSGDVFGNGMLSSNQICLKAAFNHQHIFIDPQPDPSQSFVERQRLFALPRSSWTDYNSELISAGGGVFSRSAKSIPISAEIQQSFNITETALTPNQLIQKLLCAPIDLLWNGGIGTYVKSRLETDAEVGDKANDALRVNGSELGCRVVGEGGNLGMTQLARVEFSLAGGLCNTDFIDNAGGVDCSDHEVNIKILLNAMVSADDLTLKQRNSLLEDMTDSVAERVLLNNYRQTQAISLAMRESHHRMGEYRRLIQTLEAEQRLDRELEFLPADEQLTERANAGQGLTRPELAVLLSYVKTQLKESLIASDLPDNQYVSRIIETAFPDRLCRDYSAQVYEHRLHREIIATQLANDLVDHMGSLFVSRMILSTGASPAEVIAGYISARDVFAVDSYWQQIEALDYTVPADIQLHMMAILVRLIRRASRWFIRNRRASLDPAREFASFAEPLRDLCQSIQDFIPASIYQLAEGSRDEWLEQGVPAPLAEFIANANLLYPCLGIVDAANQLAIAPANMASVYFALASHLHLDWFAGELTGLEVENHWQALARESFRDDLEWQLRTLASSVFQLSPAYSDQPQRCVEIWLENNAALVRRWQHILTELQASPQADYAMYSVALRELLDLAQSCRHSYQG